MPHSTLLHKDFTYFYLIPCPSYLTFNFSLFIFNALVLSYGAVGLSQGK